MTTATEDIRSMPRDELTLYVKETLGEPRYRADQLFHWLHGKRAIEWDAMTNLSKALRTKLGGIDLVPLDSDLVQTSTDGTRKFRFTTRDGARMESVLIPDGEKLTQCISSQVGCALGCRFCATATMGLKRHLSPSEIVDQIYHVARFLDREEEGRRITNVVYMGMGEPLHNIEGVVRSIKILTDERGFNFSPRRITVSTVGMVSGLERFGEENLRVKIAVSLNATTDDVRNDIMPVNKRWNIDALLGAIRQYPLEKRRRITFEYVLLAGVNDTMEDARRLASLLGDMKCKVNIIPWNPHPQAPYERPTDSAIARFQEEVKRRGLAVYLRTPRGDDIDAACGQLALRDSQ